MEGTKAVLVTGCSTGIGRKVTERLAAEGYLVYAGARKEEDLRALGALRNVYPLTLDVTNLDDIEAAAELIAREGRGLYGLVNNAGVLTLGSLIDCSDKEFDLLMAVNICGPYRIAKAFAPQIIAKRGRIVMVGSVQGILASANAGIYSMSKHAIEALTDSLAEEMKPHGVCVSVIEPGSYSTQIANNTAGRIGAHPRLADFAKFKDPEEVVDAVIRALFASKPRRRYLVVPNEVEAEKTIRKQIEQLVQLNEGHSYSYDRGMLIRMLDSALEEAQRRTSSS